MQNQETFEAFKNSFSYGSRGDLNFKFLKQLSTDEADRFFQELLWQLGEFFDDGDPDRLAGTVLAWQALAYSGDPVWQYEEGPFSPLQGGLSGKRLALLSSSGHFVEGDDPQPFGEANMTQEEAVARVGEFTRGEAQLSEIPVSTPQDRLRVRHGGYDIRAALKDPNTVFPVDRLRAIAGRGRFTLHPAAFSFVGATAQTPLLKKIGPQWTQMLKEQRVDAVLMVPV